MDKTLIIIPTYNEIENVPIIIPEIKKQLPDAHILVVDDNSPDGTSAKVRSMNIDGVFVLDRPEKEGLGRAYIDGFKWALKRGYDLIFEMDADLSHNPEYLPDFIKASNEADLVIGSRYCDGVRIVDWPLHRLLLSYFGNLGARFVAGIPVKDCTSGFKCFKSEVLRAIDFIKFHLQDIHFRLR